MLGRIVSLRLTEFPRFQSWFMLAGLLRNTVSLLEDFGNKHGFLSSFGSYHSFTLVILVFPFANQIGEHQAFPSYSKRWVGNIVGTSGTSKNTCF